MARTRKYNQAIDNNAQFGLYVVDYGLDRVTSTAYDLFLMIAIGALGLALTLLYLQLESKGGGNGGSSNGGQSTGDPLGDILDDY